MVARGGTRCHTAIGTTGFLAKAVHRVNVLPSLWLGFRPRNFYAFSNIKNASSGRRFSTSEAAVVAYRTLVSEISATEW